MSSCFPDVTHQKRPGAAPRVVGRVQAGDSPLQMGPKREDSQGSNTNPIAFLFNFTMGTLAGSYYFLLPIYFWLKNKIWPKNLGGF